MIQLLGNGMPDGLSRGEWHERVNDWLNWLRADPTADVAPMVDVLLRIVETSDDEVLRVYALQHLGMVRHRVGDSSLAARVDAMMSRLAAEPFDPVAGAALMMGCENDGPTDDSALRLAESERASTAARVTAIHVAVDSGDVRVLPLVRALATENETPLVLRKAAVYAIGRLGGPADAEVLSQLQGEEGVIEAAVAAARKRLAGK
ncbi:hypothetical protein [Sulfuriroseicoccus oceanibius]|uniref:HEAT repeat domain-containing protein n=1 Tax=Sulfuriroseicoccus oceanibius TaxID=2707525 RepID=A0A6B3LDA7_9BACT|nr:hypothetical protein [Sulfuriroseicoccus oceanibius]QQL44809.1 hypothetical protein G3M56_013155 [Sulfuriroseicoccus oceanibius]